MAQGAVNPKVPELPIVHLARLVEAGTWLAIGGAVVGGVVALIVRWLGWSWTFGLRRSRQFPVATLLSWRAQVCSGAYAVGSRLESAPGGTSSTCAPEATWLSEHGTASAR